jgi:hypothetical protein
MLKMHDVVYIMHCAASVNLVNSMVCCIGCSKHLLHALC